MTAIPINNHSQQALARLLYQDRAETTNDMQDIIDIYADRTQVLENLLFQVIAERQLANNTLTDTLDLIGQRDRVTREAGQSNALYKIRILAAIGQYVSYGRRSDILNILGILGATTAFVMQIFPASLIIEYSQVDIPQTFLTVTQVRNILEGATLPVDLNVGSYTGIPLVFALDPDPTGEGLGVGEIGSGA